MVLLKVRIMHSGVNHLKHAKYGLSNIVVKNNIFRQSGMVEVQI